MARRAATSKPARLAICVQASARRKRSLGAGSNFVLNGTVKPDFSQVEADATQIAADERFALFYRRETAVLRRGARSVQRAEHARVHAHDRSTRRRAEAHGQSWRARTSRCCPPWTRAWLNSERPLVDIVRLRQNFGEQSLAGLLYSDRVADGRSNRVFGGDTQLRVRRSIYFAVPGRRRA